MTSHALLLRLFLSPSFFSVHVALRYLMLYSDNIGITYYLTRRLREMDIHVLREVWGFICHLLVTRPSQSRALECFVIEIAQRSTHIAMITLWFMQALLRDHALAPQKNPSFLICQRVLHQCHEIIFRDLPPQSTSPYSSLKLTSQSRFVQRKIRPNIGPVTVGVGMLLAGAPALPLLSKVMGEVAIEQGRVEDSSRASRSLSLDEDDVARGTPNQGSVPPEEEDWKDDSADAELAGQLQLLNSTEDVLKPDRIVGASETMPALPLHMRELRRPRSCDDPFGQLDPLPEYAPPPSHSTPSVSSTKLSPRVKAPITAELLLQKYDYQALVHLLRSHYCRSEVQFLLNLEYISNRLLVVPKPARVSALRAELTALNHKLPAEICMPMWCPATDEEQVGQSNSQAHHRIVRIPPGECVVLNSAERAPYLLLVEIIHSDLDFDPSKRNNKDVLKKIVTKEHDRTGASRELIPFTASPQHAALSRRNSITNSPETVLGEDVEEPESIAQTAVPGPDHDKEEEVDLVEQIYELDHPLRPHLIDLSELIVEPSAPKNKELDMAAWSRASPEPNQPIAKTHSQRPSTPSSMLIGSRPNLHRPLMTQDSSSTAAPEGRILSLDDYSERMRTAAVMLAQLTENLGRSSLPSLRIGLQGQAMEAPGGKSWLPNPIWGTNASDATAVQNTPIPSSTARPSETAGTSVSSGSTPALQYSEAMAIRERIMKEMLALEEERMRRMHENDSLSGITRTTDVARSAEDEAIIRKELNKADPSAVVFSESWASKKTRIRQSSPYGHLANWDCVSVIVKTGSDLRQEQLAVQLIQEFKNIWREENCHCWLRPFRILITGGTSGIVETITDAVSIHSIKKAEYARRLANGQLGHVSLIDHFKAAYGDPSSSKFLRAQKDFAKSLAGYSVVTYLLQVKDRHNGNILLDREGHMIHIDFGFMLSNSPGNLGFEAAPFKLPPEYIEVLGGIGAPAFTEFKQLFKEGFETARKHCDRILTLIELMQKDSTLPCFQAAGENTTAQLRERFVPGLTHSLVGDHVDRLIASSLGSTWTRLYDSYQYYAQSIL